MAFAATSALGSVYFRKGNPLAPVTPKITDPTNPKYVLSAHIPRTEIKPFDVTNSKGYKQAQGPAQRINYVRHYARQLNEQELAINSLTAQEFIAAAND